MDCNKLKFWLHDEKEISEGFRREFRFSYEGIGEIGTTSIVTTKTFLETSDKEAILSLGEKSCRRAAFRFIEQKLSENSALQLDLPL